MPQDCRLVLFQVTSLWRHGPHPSTTTPFGVEKNGGEILTSGTSISLATTGYARKPHQTRKRAWSKLLRIWVATVNHIYCTHHLYNHPVCRHTWNAPQEEEHNILACKIKHAALGPNPWGCWNQPRTCQSLTCVRRLRVASGSRMKPLSFPTKKIMALLKSRALAAWQPVGSKTSELAVLKDLSSAPRRFSSLRGGVLTKGNQKWTKKDMPNNWLED